MDEYESPILICSVIAFATGKGEDYIYKGSSRFCGLNTHDELEISLKEKNAIIRKTPDKIFPEYYLIRVNEFNKLAVTPLEEWITYLKTGKISSEAKAPGLPEAREKLRYYDMPPQERQAYDRHLENIMIQNDVLSAAKEEGIEQGIEQGSLKATKAIAFNMKAKGLDPQPISQYTGLSLKEIAIL